MDVRPGLHTRLRLLSVVLDRSIASLVAEAIEKLLADYPSVTAEALQADRPLEEEATSAS